MMYAVIRIRGTIQVIPKLKKTLEILSLRRVNNLTLWNEDEHARNMITQAKDYVAYGKISEAVLLELIEKKARPLVPGTKIDAKKVAALLLKGKSPREAGIKRLFCMSPPRGGHERKGVKVPYSLGGALGDRKEKINALIQSMM